MYNEAMPEVDLIRSLGQFGILGVVLAISLSANFFFIRGWLGEKDKRVDDAKMITSKIIEPINTLQKTADGMMIILQNIVNNKS